MSDRTLGALTFLSAHCSPWDSSSGPARSLRVGTETVVLQANYHNSALVVFVLVVVVAAGYVLLSYAAGNEHRGPIVHLGGGLEAVVIARDHGGQER